MTGVAGLSRKPTVAACVGVNTDIVTGEPVPEPTARVWFLSGENLAATRAKLDKIQARAVRKGFTGQIGLDATPATRVQHTEGGLPVTIHGFDVTITGEPPAYGGWRFVAAVDAIDGGTIIRYPPGGDLGISNQDVAAGKCDHCHTNRARRSTMLVTNQDTGELLQVGTTCLKDFLGHDINPVFPTLDDVRSELDQVASGRATTWDLGSVLAYSWAAVQALGWTPASADTGRAPTRDVVRTVLNHDRGADDILAVLRPHVSEGQRQAPLIAAALLAGMTETTGYEANLVAVLRSGQVEARHLGLAVSAVPTYQRMLARERQEATNREQAKHVEYAGQMGDKVTLTGTVRTATRVGGYTYRSPDSVLLVVDCGTAVAKMTTAAGWAYEVEVGDQLTRASSPTAACRCARWRRSPSGWTRRSTST